MKGKIVYVDKGSLATIGRNAAVADLGNSALEDGLHGGCEVCWYISFLLLGMK